MKVARPVRRGEQLASARMLTLLPYAFSGEVQIARKHTRYAERDLRHLTARAVGELGSKLHGTTSGSSATMRHGSTISVPTTS